MIFFFSRDCRFRLSDARSHADLPGDRGDDDPLHFLARRETCPSEPGQAALLVLDVLFDDGDRAPPQVATK